VIVVVVVVVGSVVVVVGSVVVVFGSVVVVVGSVVVVVGSVVVVFGSVVVVFGSVVVVVGSVVVVGVVVVVVVGEDIETTPTGGHTDCDKYKKTPAIAAELLDARAHWRGAASSSMIPEVSPILAATSTASGRVTTYPRLE
jgi:hypothetical protein